MLLRPVSIHTFGFTFFSILVNPDSLCNVTKLSFSLAKSCMVCAFFISWQVGIFSSKAEIREDRVGNAELLLFRC